MKYNKFSHSVDNNVTQKEKCQIKIRLGWSKNRQLFNQSLITPHKMNKIWFDKRCERSAVVRVEETCQRDQSKIQSSIILDAVPLNVLVSFLSTSIR